MIHIRWASADCPKFVLDTRKKRARSASPFDSMEANSFVMFSGVETSYRGLDSVSNQAHDGMAWEKAPSNTKVNTLISI